MAPIATRHDRRQEGSKSLSLGLELRMLLVFIVSFF
jgi:hypothetical protein